MRGHDGAGGEKKIQRIAKVIRINGLWSIDVCTRFHGNPSQPSTFICKNISLLLLVDDINQSLLQDQVQSMV